MPTDLLISSILCDPLQTFNIFKTNTVRFMKNLPHPPQIFDGWLSLLAQMVKNLPAMWGAWVQFLGVEYPLEKETATHSKILAWKIPWVEEPGELQSMGSQRVRPHWVTNTFILDILYKPLWHCFPHATGGRNNFISRSFMMVPNIAFVAFIYSQLIFQGFQSPAAYQYSLGSFLRNPAVETSTLQPSQSAWSEDQQHWHHLGASEKWGQCGFTADIMNRTLQQRSLGGSMRTLVSKKHLQDMVNKTLSSVLHSYYPKFWLLLLH